MDSFDASTSNILGSPGIECARVNLPAQGG